MEYFLSHFIKEVNRELRIESKVDDSKYHHKKIRVIFNKLNRITLWSEVTFLKNY